MTCKIIGKVIKGDGYGKKIGFPTANIDRRQFVGLKSKPKLGIYAGRVHIGPKVYKAGIVIGPIDSEGLPKLEAHLIKFKGNLYGKKITIEPIKYLRPFTKYRGEQELINQIKKDIKLVIANIRIKS